MVCPMAINIVLHVSCIIASSYDTCQLYKA